MSSKGFLLKLIATEEVPPPLTVRIWSLKSFSTASSSEMGKLVMIWAWSLLYRFNAWFAEVGPLRIGRLTLVTEGERPPQ